MAIFHLNLKTIGRSQGRSSTAAAAYRAGVRIVDDRTGLVFDYTRKRGVDGAEIIAPDGPCPDRSVLWNAVEKVERRVDAQLAREIELALPRELTPEQMRGAVREFVREQFTARGMVADIAYHHLTRTNPHAHILLTLREWGTEGFGLKRRDWNDRDLCAKWRECWAQAVNAALMRAGHAERIDHRTLLEQAAEAVEQGRDADAVALDRVPTIHERGSPLAHERNAAIRQANAHRLTQWVKVENAAFDRPPEAPAWGGMSKSDHLAAADASFETTMTKQRGTVAAHWRMLHRQAKALADWLEEHAGERARRLQERDETTRKLRAARHERNRWLRENPRPFWPWRWRGWARRRAAYQQPVDEARKLAAFAEKQGSPEGIIKWEREYEAHRKEHAAVIAQRRKLAPMPSEAEQVKKSAQEAKVSAQETNAEPAHDDVPAAPRHPSLTRPR